MDLKQFIVETMKGITEGIAECEKVGVKINMSNYNDVVFDVAVTVENSAKDGVGGSLKIVGFDIGGKKEKENSTTAISRINFHITHIPSESTK